MGNGEQTRLSPRHGDLFPGLILGDDELGDGAGASLALLGVRGVGNRVHALHGSLEQADVAVGADHAGAEAGEA